MSLGVPITVDELRLDRCGHDVCACGDLATAQRDVDCRRDDGSRRGVCGCFRRRNRQHHTRR